MWLLVHYPMMRQDWTTLATSVNREHLLITSITIMELSYQLETNKELSMAVTLVELCSQVHMLLAGRAWTIVDTKFERWSARVADKRAGFI
jgi:hypothetical protein